MSKNGNGGPNGQSYAAAAGIGTDENNGNGSATHTLAPQNQPQQNHAQQSPPPDTAASVGDNVDVKTAALKKSANHILLKVAAIIAGVLLITGVTLYYLLSSGGPEKRKVSVNVPGQSGHGQDTNTSDSTLTAEAIARARNQIGSNANTSTEVAGTQGKAPQVVVQQNADPVVPVKVGTATMNANANANTDASNPVVRTADGVAGTVNSDTQANANTARANSSGSGSGGNMTSSRTTSTRAPSKANGQKALVYGEDESRSSEQAQESGAERQPISRPINAGFAMGVSGGRTAEALIAPVRPAFGALLPVRTLGAIYTLRSGGLVRLELTRDVSGPGWKLPRRIVIVGTIRGSEADRAYVSIIGYIDSASGRLVTFGGSLLGADAGEGIKGEKRQVTSRWSRVLGTIADRGFSLAQTVLGRGNGATIVLSQAGSPEINALTRNGNNREFVAVKAGSMGYISVTDLPREIEGVDALTQMSPDELAQLLNAGANTNTGLNDEEVAQLISSGTPAQIRAAMPRMNDQMRQIAEQVVNESERR